MVTKYAEDMQRGEKFPPIIIFQEGENNYIGDGHHRVYACIKIGAPSIECEVNTGGVRQAKLYSSGSNFDHGLARSNADKERAVAMLLDDIEYGEWSDDKIAKHVHVDRKTVVAIRARLDKPGKATKKVVVGEQIRTRSAKEATPEPEPAAEQEAEPQGITLQEAYDSLVIENQFLRDKLAVGLAEGTEEEKTLLADTLQSLRDEVALKEITINALKKSRDTFQRENAEMMKQLARNKKGH
jgi:ParB-like chromosome segregation protein Spo0J